MASVAMLCCASPCVRDEGGRVCTSSGTIARDQYGLYSCLSPPTSCFIWLRGRERASQLTMSSRYAPNGISSTRHAAVYTGLSERVGSSLFCSSSSTGLNSENDGSGSLPRKCKARTRRHVSNGFKQIHLSVTTLGNWNCRLEQNVPKASRGQHPRSDNLDVEDFKFDGSSRKNEGPEAVVETLEFTGLAHRIDEDAEEIEAEIAVTAPSSGRVFISKRWTIVLLCFTAFLLCNMDRVNMSIAVLPMAAEYQWNSTTVGLVQSSFFWGYLLTQIAGGIWADSIGGKQVLGFGVIWWSLATVLTPIAAKIGLPALFFVRACMGVGEGVAMPAMNNLLSRWIPIEERSRSLAFVYSGMYLGSVTGLACSPTLIHVYGWPSVFFSFGSVGIIWFTLWQQYAHSTPAEDPTISDAEMKLILKGNKPKEPITRIPWGMILSKAPVWALIVCHFCHNWGTFILLTWMPTYYNQVLGFNLMESGLFSVLPWLTMAVSANIGGWIADTLVSKGYSVTTVRKVMQSIGFLGPAFFLTQLSHITSPPLAVLCMMASQGSDAFSQAGLYSNHQDIGPRYSGILLGLSNTAGVLAGVFGTAATGYILQHGSWDDVFKVAVGLYLFGTVVWNIFATGEQLFD